MTLGAVILAGGESSRMGFPKAWLPFDSNHTFLGKIISVFQSAGISDVITVLNSRYSGGIWSNRVDELSRESRIILNHESSKGRMHSLRLALKELNHPFVFIHNVDNPFIQSDVIRKLRPNKKDEVVSPVFKNQKGHPVLISRKVMDAIMQKSDDDVSLKSILSDYTSRLVKVGNSSILKNLNVPYDYIIARYELDT